jgi:ERF superfamily
MEQSERIDELAAALSAAQGEMESVSKTESAEIPGKDGKRGFSYDYADLPGVVDAVRPILAKHGLSVAQFPVTGPALVTQVMHSSGQWMRGTVDLPVGPNVTAQALGSAITYLRRYSLGAALGIVTDTDDDGAKATSDRGGASSNQTQRRHPPETGEGATPKQLALVSALMADCGIPEAGTVRLEYASEVIGRAVGSSKEMTKAEASKLIDALNAEKDGDTEGAA